MPNNDYRSTIYSAMQSAYPGDFTLKEDEFRKNLDENPAYAKTVFSAVKSAYGGEFNLSEQDFYKKIAGQAPSKTPTAGDQPAPAQAPIQKAPRNPNTAYFKYLIEPFKDSDVFQRMLQEYDPKNPDQGAVTQYMSSLKKRSYSVTGIGVQNYKNDEYAAIDALTKDFQARKASEAEQIYNGNKEAFDAYRAMSEKAESIASQIKKVAKQRDAIQNTKISVDDQKSLGVIKSQYDNLLAQLKDRDKTFLKLDSEMSKKSEELKHAMDMGIPDVMLSSYNQEISAFNQRIADEYEPSKKERDALVSKLKELDNSYNAVLSKYPGLSDSRFKSLNGTVQALYSQYNGIVNQIEDFENQYGSDLSKIQENYRLINEAEKFRWQAYSGSGYNQQAQKETDESIKQSGALSNPVANFVVSTLARTATVFLNTTKDLLSAPETLANMSEAGKEIAKSPQVAPVMNLLKAATETLDFIAQDDKPSYDPGDAMSPYTGQSFYKYDKFQKFDDKTGEWSKTGAGYLQEGIAQIAQIYVAGGITKGAMTGIGAETVSAGKAISAIARQGAAASKSEILGFAKTAAVSTGVMGAVSLPGYYREGLSKFGDNDFARAYATSMAAAEGLLETILPDADLAARFSKNLGVSDLYKIWKSEGKKGLITIIKDRSSDLVKENIEEIGAQAAGHIFERIGAAFNAEGTDGINSISQWDWDETAETAGIVSISMGVLGVPGAYGAYKMNRPGAMPSPGRSRAIFEMAKRYNVEDPNNEVTIGLQSLATTGAVSQQELSEIEKHIHAASVVLKNMNLDQLGVGQRTKEAIAVVLADAEVESQRIEALSSSGISSEKLKSASEAIRAKAQDKVAEILSDPEFEQKSADQELKEAQEAEEKMAQDIESEKREQIRLGANMPMATHAVGATVEYNGKVGVIELSDSNRVLFVDNETGKSEEIPLNDHTTDSAMNAGIRVIEGVANPSVMDSLDLVLMDVPGSTVEGGRRKPYYVQVKSKAGKVADENALVFSQSKKSKNLHEVKDPQMKAKIIAEYNKQKIDEGMPSVKSSEKAIEERSMESPQTRNTSYVSNAVASENKTPKEADEAREALEAARKSGVLAQDLKDGAVKYSEVSKAYRAVGIPVVPLDIRSEFAEKEDEYDMPQMDSSTEAVSQEEGSATPSGKARRIQVRGRSFPLPDSVSMLASEQETEKKRSYATPGSLLHSNLGMLIKVQRALNKLFGAKSVKYAIFWNQDEFNQFTKEVNPGNTGNSFYDKASNTIFLSSQTLLNEDKFHESIHPIVAAYFATPDGDVKMQKFFQDMINESSSDHVKWQNQTGTTRTAKEYVSSAVKLWMGVRSVDMKRLSQVDPEAYDFLSSSIATYSMAWMEFYKELGSISGKPMSFDALMNEGVTEYATQVVVLASAASNSNNSAKRLFSLADMIMSKVGLSKKKNTIPTSPSGITDIIAAESLHAFASGIGSAFANAEVIEGRKLELRLPDSSDEGLLYSMRPVIQAHFERDVQMKIMREIEEGGLYNKMSASDIAKHILPQNIYKEIAWVFDLSDKLGIKISVDSKYLSQNFARGTYRSSVGVITIGEQSFNSKYNVLPPYLSFVGTVFHEFVHALLDPSNGVVSDFHIDEIRSKCTELHGIISKKVDEILADDNSSIMDIESAFVWNGLFKDTYSPKNADWNDTFEELITYGLSDIYIGHLMKISSPTGGNNGDGVGSFIFGKIKEEYDGARAPQENHLEDSVLDEVSRMLDKAAYETVSFTGILETSQADNGRILFSKRFDMSSLSSEELKKAVEGTPWVMRENLLKSIKDHSYVYRTIYGEFDMNWPGRQYFSLDLAYTLGYGNRTYRFIIPNKDVLNLHDYNVLFRSSPKSSMYSLPGEDLFEIHSDNYQQGQPLWIQLATYGRVVGKEAEQELKEKVNKYKAHRAKDSGSEHDAIAIENTSLLVDPIDWLSEFLKSPDLSKVYDQDLAKQFLMAAAESYYGGVDFSMRVWHGSPHRLDRFSMDHIGTGEGVQAFGWGLYFTELKDIAKVYAQQLSTPRKLPIRTVVLDRLLDGELKNEIIDGYPKEAETIYSEVIKFLKDNESFIKKTGKLNSIESRIVRPVYMDGLPSNLRKDIINDIFNRISPLSSHLYEVTLHKGKTPDQYNWLDWDKPVSEETLNKIARQGKEEGFEIDSDKIKKDDAYGKDVYREIGTLLAQEKGINFNRSLDFLSSAYKEASMFLLRSGIDGIRYPAESLARGTTSDTAMGFNYVVFDENAVEIENRVDFSMRAPKFRELGTAERISRQFVGQNIALSVLRSDPSRLYTPQRWDEIKDDLDMMSEAQIINYIDNGDASSIENYIASIGNTGTSANMWVMANIELMNRYEASGNEAMAAAVYSRLMQSATYFAQALAQYAKLNSSSAAHLTRRIVAHIKSFGRTVTKAQVSLLESDVKRMMMANKAVSDYLLNQKEELDTNGISTFSVDAHNALEKSRMEANKRLDEKLSKLMPESLWEALGTNMRGNLLTLGSSTIGLFSNITNAAFLATGGMSRATDYALNKTGVSRGMSTRTVNPISFTNILLKTMSRFFSKENLNRYAEIMKSGEVFDGQANEKYDVSRSLRPLLAMRHGIKMLQDIANNDFSKFDASFKTSTKEYDAVTWSIDMAANTISVSLSKSGKNVGSFTMDTVSYEDFIDNPVVIDQINASVHSGVHAGTIMESGKAYVPRASKTEAAIKLGASGLLAAVPAVMLRAIQMSDTPIREVTTFGRLYEYGYVLGLRGADLELFARAPHLWGQQMANRVVQEASAVTFQEHTMLGDLVRKVTGGKTMLNNIGKDSSGNLMLRGMRRFFVGMIQPFISFPANFLSQSLEYVVWQYTLAKSIYHMHEVKMSATVQERDINRQKAVRAFSKAMVGMALEKAALYLIYAGIITLPPDDDDKKQSAAAKTVGDRKFNADGLRRWMDAGGFSNPENPYGAYQEGDDLWSIESLGILGTFIQLAASDAANNIQENTDSAVLGTEGGVNKLKKVKSGSLISEPENEGVVDKTLGFFMNTMDHAIVLTSSVFEFGFMQGTANLMASIPKMSKGNRSEEVNRLVSGMAKAASAAVLPGVGLAGQVNRFMVEQERSKLSQEDSDDFGFNVFTQKRPGENRPIENTIGYSVRQSLASYGFGKISPEMFVSEGVFPAVDMFGQPVNYSGKPKNLIAYMLNPTRAEDGDYSEQELFLYSLQKSIAPGRDMKSAMAIPSLPMEKMTIDVSLPDGTSVPVAVGAKEWADFNKIAGAYIRKEIYSILDKYDYKSMNPFVVDSKRAKLVTELTEKYKEMGTGDQLAQYSGDPAIISAYERLVKSAIRRMSEDEEVGSVPVKDESTGKSMPIDKAVKESIQE